MPTATRTLYTRGTEVAITGTGPGRRDEKFPGIWTIDQVNPSTYSLTQRGRGLKAHHSLAVEPTEADRAAMALLPEIFYPGEFVQSASPERPGLWVVLGSGHRKSRGRQRPIVHIAKAGGDSGQYWRVSPPDLTRIPLADAHTLLQATAALAGWAS